MATTPNFNWSTPDNTGLVKNGALDIRTLGNSIDASMTDLLGGTTGQVLAKASNTDMDFTWSAGASVPTSIGFAAGKNKIINGDFNVWQRGTTLTSQYGYVSDRWLYYQNGSSGVTTISQQTFPVGNTIAGYEPTYFIRVNQTTAGTGATTNSIFTNLEDVRLFAGQTATISFWAKAGSGTPSITPVLTQVFGSGGSTAVTTSYTAIPITTSWARYTQTISIPSISGKTVGTSSYLTVNLGIPLNTVQTIDFWGVQLEAGSTATAFQTATGTLQGELAACQRYYYRNGGTNQPIGIGQAGSSTLGVYTVFLPTQMRTQPTIGASSTASQFSMTNGSDVAISCNSVPVINLYGTQVLRVQASVASGLTAGQGSMLFSTNSAAYIEYIAEL
jgi:hypothetical protein